MFFTPGSGIVIGTYEPSVTFPGVGSVSASQKTLSYAVDGNIVHIDGRLDLTHDGTGGSITVSLPFPCEAGGGETRHVLLVRGTSPIDTNNFYLQCENGAAVAKLLYDAGLTAGAILNGTAVVNISGWYTKA